MGGWHNRAVGTRPDEVAFVAWGAVAGRSEEIAETLGGWALCLDPPSPAKRPPAPLRYLTSTLRTLWHLSRARPRSVIVTCPPVPAAAVALAWGRLMGARVVLDCHPGSFGAQGDRASARLVPMTRRLVARAGLCLVASEKFADIVRGWGGHPLVFHEAPRATAPTAAHRHRRLRVLCVSRFAGDEPVDVVVEAAARAPGCDLRITGDPARCPPALAASAPPNVTFVGFLDGAAYRAELAEADVVVTLTTEEGSVMRAAYEATYALRPLVVSDWPINHELFPHALHVEHRPESLARALTTMDRCYAAFAARCQDARTAQLERFEGQRQALLDVLGEGCPVGPTVPAGA